MSLPLMESGSSKVGAVAPMGRMWSSMPVEKRSRTARSVMARRSGWTRARVWVVMLSSLFWRSVECGISNSVGGGRLWCEFPYAQAGVASKRRTCVDLDVESVGHDRIVMQPRND